MITESRRPSALLLAGLALAGCRDAESGIPIHPTSGRVLAAAGKPAAGALVTFHPAESGGALPFVPHAAVEQDGTFRLTSVAPGDGAPVGEYLVAVTWPPIGPDGDPKGPDRLAGKYADPKKPLCRVTVRAGENRLEPFHLK